MPGLAFFVLHLVSPSDGARLTPGQAVWTSRGVLLTPFQLNSPLQPGDVLVAINGQPLEALAQQLFHPATLLHPDEGWHAGQEVRYTVLRHGQHLDILVKLQPFPLLRVLSESWGTLLLSLVFQGLAIFVFLHRPQEAVARTMLLSASGLLGSLTWSFGLQITDLVQGAGFWLFQMTTYGSYQIFWAAGLHFTWCFAAPHVPLAKHRWLAWLIYLVSLVFYPLNLALTSIGSANTLEWIGRWSPGEGALSVIYLVGIIAVILLGYRSSQDALLRQKVRWVIFVAVLCGTSSLLLWTVPTDVLGISLLSVNVLGLLLLPFPISLVFAILRHRLFDIDVIIRRTMVYSILTGSLALIYAGLVLTLQMLLHVFGEPVAQSPPILVISTLGTAALFQPLRRAIQRIIDRRFYRSRYDAARTLVAFSASMSSEVELNQLSQRLLTVVQETMQPASLSLWIRSGELKGKTVLFQATSKAGEADLHLLRVSAPGDELKNHASPDLHNL